MIIKILLLIDFPIQVRYAKDQLQRNSPEDKEHGGGT